MGHRWGDEGIALQATTVIERIGRRAPKQSAPRIQQNATGEGAKMGTGIASDPPFSVFALTRRALQLANIILSSSMIFSSV